MVPVFSNYTIVMQICIQWSLKYFFSNSVILCKDSVRRVGILRMSVFLIVKFGLLFYPLLDSVKTSIDYNCETSVFVFDIKSIFVIVLWLDLDFVPLHSAINQCCLIDVLDYVLLTERFISNVLAWHVLLLLIVFFLVTGDTSPVEICKMYIFF